MRTGFDESTVAMLAPKVQRWIDAVDVAAWRGTFQSARRVADRDFFLRFLPEPTDREIPARAASGRVDGAPPIPGKKPEEQIGARKTSDGGFV